MWYASMLFPSFRCYKGCPGWVDQGGWLHTEMVYLPAYSHQVLTGHNIKQFCWSRPDMLPLNQIAPPYLSDDCQLITDVGRRHLRSADVHTCTVPRTQSRLRDRSFRVAGPRLWDSLPVELRQQDICLTKFRRLLKTLLFAETRRIVTSLF